MKKFKLIQLAEDYLEYLGIHAFQNADGNLYAQLNESNDLQVTDRDILYYAVKRLEKLSSTGMVVLIGDMVFEEQGGSYGLHELYHVYDCKDSFHADDIAEEVTNVDKKSSGWISSEGLFMQLDSTSYVAPHLTTGGTEFRVNPLPREPKKVYAVYAEQAFFVGHEFNDIEASSEEEAKNIVRSRIRDNMPNVSGDLEYSNIGNADAHGITIHTIKEVK